MKYILKFIAILTMGIALISGEARAEASDAASEKMVKICTFEDGASVALHYNPEELKSYHNDVDEYVDAVFKYAIEAYTEIVFIHGFNTPGFAFANPDKTYHYDPDKIIDIYIIGSLDAPRYDIIKGEAGSYDAIILFPTDYKGYLIRGALVHEMLHIIVYSYNRNIAPWSGSSKGAAYCNGCDWYVEGLAGYFEAMQEDVNYTTKNPSELQKAAKYDYPLFWAYIHKNYGMGAIEEISRSFRFISEDSMKEEMPAIFSAVLKKDFNSIFMEFGMAMYYKYFNPDIESGQSDLTVISSDVFFDEREKKVASWASNFVTVDLYKKGMPEIIALKKIMEDGELKMSVFAGFEDGRIARVNKVTLDNPDQLCEISLIDMKHNGVKELILIITNTGHASNMSYKILTS